MCCISSDLYKKINQSKCEFHKTQIFEDKIKKLNIKLQRWLKNDWLDFNEISSVNKSNCLK